MQDSSFAIACVDLLSQQRKALLSQGRNHQSRRGNSAWWKAGTLGTDGKGWGVALVVCGVQRGRSRYPADEPKSWAGPPQKGEREEKIPCAIRGTEHSWPRRGPSVLLSFAAVIVLQAERSFLPSAPFSSLAQERIEKSLPPIFLSPQLTLRLGFRRDRLTEVWFLFPLPIFNISSSGPVLHSLPSTDPSSAPHISFPLNPACESTPTPVIGNSRIPNT